MRRSVRRATAAAVLTSAGTMTGWMAAVVYPHRSNISMAHAALWGNTTTGLIIGLCLAFIGGSLAQGVAHPRPRSRRARTAEQCRRSTIGQRSDRPELEGDRRRPAPLQATVPQRLQVYPDGQLQLVQPPDDRSHPNPSVQSHLLGVHKMSTPSPRSTPAVEPVSAILRGHGRGSANGPIDLALILTLQYRTSEPYEVTVRVAQRGDLHGGELWLVSRETLCIAAVWQTQAGNGDFRAVPMGDHTTQLVFVATDHDQQGEVLHVDVDRRDLLGFLDRTAQVVRPGCESEHLDMDAVVAALLSDQIR